MTTPDKLRIDEALVTRGLYTSRARARDAVLRGTVNVNGVMARKPAQMVAEADVLTSADGGQNYVSRAALKLIHALDHFALPVKGRRCLDLGASSGGFTQVLLERGATEVIAIEVGHGQMVLQDERIKLLEGMNARDLTRQEVPADVSVITCDVSFIPLHIALDPALDLVAEGSWLVALLKPQFEVGRGGLAGGGIVRDAVLKEKACADVADYVHKKGWQVKGIIASPIDGGDGNEEFLLAAVK
ncbi:MAG: TlyA family RNA methyltransferase [Pseudomonadota bacterium]|nr:TlyA family RNA methyltransferase [Pseudomonadota bacterium]